jgi:3-isopropylmalate/(R)-2-methylmalate dehydratase small subunit
VKPFRSVTARAAVLDRPDVDTDQIIPKQFQKRSERTGYGEFHLHDWRQDPDYELSRPGCDGAKILVTGPNFGCGSSREHAAWALQDYGFDVVIAPSFGDIFFTNATQIGLLPIRLAPDEVKELMATIGDGGEVTVDLETQAIVDPVGRVLEFDVDPFIRHCRLNGLDTIGLTLRHEAAITAFEAQSPSPVSTASL